MYDKGSPASDPGTTMKIRLEKAVSIAGVNSKVATFGRLTAGDCIEEEGGTLLFEDNGTAVWDVTTFTSHTHSGDIWHATFVIKDQFNAKLFQLPSVSSPKMSDDGTKYRWQRTFKYDNSLFDRLAFCDYSFSC
jgi:Family of unknown function (DUF6294)